MNPTQFATYYLPDAVFTGTAITPAPTLFVADVTLGQGLKVFGFYPDGAAPCRTNRCLVEAKKNGIKNGICLAF